ncbi:ATP-binding protein [Streptomyces sp. NBC_00151]|uniref:ATP-binding protein n=1 Tax=Streptomyces sp. NBC_00151 TaxID=2975669 RepID=UPI002DDA945A|nr:ATP-binding protein [Streptomyces sp. NBC_00151]WRZ39950.1 ATP-binding protein [Streptomyces sp. NBC_00151]
MTTFVLRFSATPRGARLARRLASHQMDLWGWAYGSPVHDTVELIVAELAANAVTHGRVPGRDAELRLSRDDGTGHVRVEVTDVRGERLPVQEPLLDGRPLTDGGRGLAIVAALAENWGVAPRPGTPAAPGKVVWAVLSVAPKGRPARTGTQAGRTP